jgi:peptidyl-prolyl cis-trans isomerase C
LTNPVKTQFGYHVIKLEDRRQAPPPSFEELPTRFAMSWRARR